MSRPEADIALGVMCARCEARPGQPCTTLSGGKATYLHAARTDAIRESWTAGYLDGAREAIDAAERYVTRQQDRADLDPLGTVLRWLGVLRGQYRA